MLFGRLKRHADGGIPYMVMCDLNGGSPNLNSTRTVTVQSTLLEKTTVRFVFVHNSALPHRLENTRLQKAMPIGSTTVPQVLPECSRPVAQSRKLDKACVIPGRDPRLPTIYEAFNHPLTQCANSRSFYVKQDLHEARMQEALDLEKELKIPLGNAEQVSALGKNLLPT